MSSNLQLVPLGKLLTRSDEQIEINPLEQYKQVTVRMWGNGVTLRDIVTGQEIASKKRYIARCGQFIMSRIDARHGAFGLVPEELDGALVTNDFPLFTINQSLIVPSYLEWYSKTESFIQLCLDASEGTTNRVRLKLDRFREMKIPLPSIEVQLRLVSYIQTLATRLGESFNLQQIAVQETETLIDSELNSIIEAGALNDAWMFDNLSQFVELNPSKRSIQNQISDEHLVTFVPMSAVDDYSGTITMPEVRRYHEVSKGYTYFAENDVIFAKITPCMQNGKSAIARGLENNIAFGSTEFHVLRSKAMVIPEWIHYLVRSKAFRAEAETHFKGSAGQQRVPKSFLVQKKIGVPPIKEQQLIIDHLNNLKLRVEDVRRLQQQVDTELSALLPSVLNMAFNGEL